MYIIYITYVWLYTYVLCEVHMYTFIFFKYTDTHVEVSCIMDQAWQCVIQGKFQTSVQ